MPGISDPGARLVAAAADRGVIVTVVPGPSAVVAALVASGLPTDRFCFEGFLPRRGELRRRRIEELSAEERTVGPVRVAPTAGGHFGRSGAHVRAPSGAVAVARELTKVHEEIWRGTLSEAGAHFAVDEVRGEVVVVLGGARPTEALGDGQVVAALERSIAEGDSRRDAAASVAQALGVPHRRAYALALGLDRGEVDRSRGAVMSRRPALKAHAGQWAPWSIPWGGAPPVRHHAHLLRQRRPPCRPRLHDGHRRRPGPVAPAAR